MIGRVRKPDLYEWGYFQGHWVVIGRYRERNAPWTNPSADNKSFPSWLLFWQQPGRGLAIAAMPMDPRAAYQILHEEVGVSFDQIDIGTTICKGVNGMPTPCRKMVEVGLPEIMEARVVREHRGTLAGIQIDTQITAPVETRNDITYINLAGAPTKTHSIDALHRTLLPILVECRQTWGWQVPAVEVFTHKGNRVMGAAYRPGNGILRRISFNERLLQEYDLAAIGRTWAHELCHHAREELAPRRMPRGAASTYYHDSLFCQMLGQVDPLVLDNQNECVYFEDEMLPEVAVAKSQAKAKRLKATQASLQSEQARVLMRFLKNKTISVYLEAGGKTVKIGTLGTTTLDAISRILDTENILHMEVALHPGSSAWAKRSANYIEGGTLGEHLQRWAVNYPQLMMPVWEKWGNA